MACRNTGRLGRGKGRRGLVQRGVLARAGCLADAHPCAGDGRAWGGRPPQAALKTETQATPTWTSLGLGGGGAMYTPAISPADPNRILLSCDMSGAYRSIDGGKNWEMIHYRQLTGSTKVSPAWHPADPNVAFAASGWQGTLKLTRDGGKTWNDVPGVPAPIVAIAIDPGRPELMLAGSRRGISPLGRRREDLGVGRAGSRESPRLSLRPDQHGGEPHLFRGLGPEHPPLRRCRRDMARPRGRVCDGSHRLLRGRIEP